MKKFFSLLFERAHIGSMLWKKLRKITFIGGGACTKHKKDKKGCNFFSLRLFSCMMINFYYFAGILQFLSETNAAFFLFFFFSSHNLTFARSNVFLTHFWIFFEVMLLGTNPSRHQVIFHTMG